MYAYDHHSTPQNPITLLPDEVRPPYNTVAEHALQAAINAYRRKDWGDALLLLGEAVEADPRLQQDAYAIQLAGRLTGSDPTKALSLLAHPAERSQLIAMLQRRRAHYLPAINTITMVFISIGIALAGLYALSAWLPRIQSVIAEVNTPPQVEVYTQMVGDVAFDVYVPEGQPSDPGWPMLVLLGDPMLSGNDLLPHFLVANDRSVVYVIPHLPQQPMEMALPILHEMIAKTENIYPTALDSVVLYGFGEGGDLATLYARRYPNIAAGAVTSGSTLVHAPAPNGAKLLVMLGDQDSLYTSSGDGQSFSFLDANEWQDSMPYLLLEGIGHEIDPQQVDFALEFVSDIHADALE